MSRLPRLSSPIRVAYDHTFGAACAFGSKLRRSVGCDYPNSELEQTGVMLDMIGHPWELVNTPYNDTFGTYEAFLYMLNSGQVDTDSVEWVITKERLHQYAFSNPIPTSFTNNIYAIDVSYYGGASLIESTIKFLSVFDLYTLLAVVTLFACLNAGQCLAPKIVVRQHVLFSPRFNNSTIALVIAVLLTLYRSSLLAQLLIPMNSHRFHSERELASLVESGDIQIIARSTHSIEYRTIVSKTKWLSKAIQTNPVLSTDNLSRALELIRVQSHVFVLLEEEATSLVDSECDLRSVQLTDNLERQWAGFIFHKNASQELINRFNQAIEVSAPLRQGIVQRYHLRNKHEQRCDEGSSSSGPRRKKTKLKLDHVLGAFIVLSVGVGISIVVEVLLCGWKCVGRIAVQE